MPDEPQQFVQAAPEHEQYRIHQDALDRYSPKQGGPVISVSWYAAVAYCNWLSRKENLPQCYEPNDKGQYAEGMKIRADALQRTGYRLPTEAEWEYACRAEAESSRYYGFSEELLGEYAWYLTNTTNDRAQPCASLLPNELGLFDMLGNVYEWCNGRAEDYPAGEGPRVIDNINIFESLVNEYHRGQRSGSFSGQPHLIRSAARGRDRPWSCGTNYGFRPSRTYP